MPDAQKFGREENFRQVQFIVARPAYTRQPGEIKSGEVKPGQIKCWESKSGEIKPGEIKCWRRASGREDPVSRIVSRARQFDLYLRMMEGLWWTDAVSTRACGVELRASPHRESQCIRSVEYETM